MIKKFINFLADYQMRENAKYRAEAKQNAAAAAAQSIMSIYFDIAALIAQAANNIADGATVVRVRDISQICCTPPVVSRTSPVYGEVWGAVYRLRLDRGAHITAQALARMLQKEVNILTGFSGLPPLQIYVWYGADGTVNVWVVFAESLQPKVGVI